MYNKSEIMSAAWAMYRNGSRNRRGEIQGTFADCLRMAWGNAKRRAQTVTDQAGSDAEFLYQMQDHHSNAEVAAHYYGKAIA